MKRNGSAIQSQAKAGTAEPVLPVVLRSSDQLGWGEIGAELCRFPAGIDSFRPAPPAGLAVSLIMHGAVDFEQRAAHSAWQTYALSSGTMSLHDAEPLEFRWQRRSAERVDVLKLCLSTELVGGVLADVTKRDASTIAFRRLLGGYDPLLMQLGLVLQQELEQPTPTGALYAQSAAQLLAVHLVRHYSSLGTPVPEPSAGLTQRQLAQIQDYVQTNLAQPLKLADLARHLSLSPYYFVRLFRRATGESPHQHVLRHRLERAQWLLKETDVPIAQVAAECGLGSQTHLTTLFTRRLGVTPRAYRRCAR